MHQVVKKIAKNSNYRNVSKRIVFFHTIQLALAFAKAKAKQRKAEVGEQ